MNKSATEGRQDVFDWRLVAGNKIITTGSQSSVSALCAELSLSCATIETNRITISRREQELNRRDNRAGRLADWEAGNVLNC